MAFTSRPWGFVALVLALVACGEDAKPDETPPEITIEAPAAGERVADPVTVSGTVKDAKVKGHKTTGVASVMVDGVAATLEGERFSATLSGLSPGPITITVEALDKKGNAATATVDVVVGPPITILHVEPAIVSLSSTSAAVQLRTTGFFAGSGSSDLTTGTTGLTFVSTDESVALVSATGVVTAASADAAGTAEITVRYGELTDTVTARVHIDVDTPIRPKVTGYFAESNERHQTWAGATEPDAQIAISGSASPIPIELTADKFGRFWVDIPLEANRVHPILLKVTDVNGNFDTFDFPITQSDGLADAGTLHLSSVRRMTGFVGEPLPELLVARAYDAAGSPLAGAEVTFQVASGGGELGADGGNGAPTRYLTKTDGAGYARARWTLGPSDFGEVEVHASLAGDVGFPVVFKAEGFMHLDQPTAVEGVVYDENRVPVIGLPVTLLAPGTEYAPDTRGASGTTDARGHFRIFFAPDLPEPTSPRGQHIRLDGTAMLPQKHVRIDRLVTILPGQINDAGTFWIPRLPEGVAPKLDGAGLVTEEIVLEREVIAGNGPVRVRVPVGTRITWPGGVSEDARRLALLAIPEIRAPMSLPDGFFSREVLALQPGGTRFDPPLPLDMPNSGDEPPGDVLTMWSYDHFQSKFVPVGHGVVSADGTRVVSEPGSGIRVGAWHKVAPDEPEPPCTATGQTKVTTVPGTPGKKGKKSKCKCYIEGTDQPTDCPEDKDDDGIPDKFVITNIAGCKSAPPPPPPDPNNKPKPKPPTKKVEVVCEEEPLRITNPTEPVSHIKKGDTIAFTAECLDDHKSDPAIKWQRSAPAGESTTPPDVKTGTGPKFTIRFDHEGTYVVSASANTKTCKGSDQRTVEVKGCAETGSVRVCGDKVEPVGSPVDGRSRVSGNVRMGLRGRGSEPGSTTPDAGELYLQVGGPMLVDAAGALPESATSVSMVVGYPLVGPKLTPIIASSTFTVSPKGEVDIAPTAGGTYGSYRANSKLLRLVAWPILFQEFKMQLDGILIKNPNLELMDRQVTYQTWSCPKPKRSDSIDPAFHEEYKQPRCDINEWVVAKEGQKSHELQFVFDGVEVTKSHIFPNGYIEYKPTNEVGEPGLDLGSKFFKLTSLKVQYLDNRLNGELGLQLSLKRFDLGIKTTLSIGESYFAGELGVTFSGFEVGPLTLPGIPILPSWPISPTYLSSLGLAYESSAWPISDTQMTKLTGKAGITVGPTLTLLTKKVALATGNLSMSMVLYPMQFSLRGELTLLKVLDVDIDSAKTTSTAKLAAQLDMILDPDFALQMSGELSVFVPKLFGQKTTGIKDAAGDPVIKGAITGRVTVSGTDGNLKSTASGWVTLQIPRLGGYIPRTTLATGSAGLRYDHARSILELFGQVTIPCYPYTCTWSIADDPVNGTSAWLLTSAGDLIPVIGKHPNRRAVIPPSAPTLGVTRDVAIDAPYTGDPLSIELLEPAPRFMLTLAKREGPVAGVLILPNGTEVAPSENPAAEAEATGVAWFEGADGLSATWIVYEAEPGTYTYRGPNDGDVIDGIHAVASAPQPVLVFDEPFRRAAPADDLTIAWSGSGGNSAATVMLIAVPVETRNAEGWYELGTFPLDGDGALDADEGLMPAGSYRIAGEVRSQGTRTWVFADGTYTLGIPVQAEAGAPSLIEVDEAAPRDGGGASLRVTWLPGEGAARHVVTLLDDLGAVVASAGVPTPGNEVTLLVPAGARTLARGGGRLLVEGFSLGGRTAATLSLPVDPESLLSAPPRFVRVGEPWTWRAAAASVRTTPVVVDKGPSGVEIADDGAMTWTPNEADLGEHGFRVRFGEGDLAQEREFRVQVLEAGAQVAPEPTSVAEARVVPGVIDEPLSFSAEFRAFEAVTLELVAAPVGASMDAAGIVTWTPTAAEVDELVGPDGAVPIAVRATAGSLSNEARWLVRFADSDGDGLTDAWETASGTSPDTPDSGTGDGDDDGVADREEQAAGTRGDIADSDGDGLDDGADPEPRLADRDFDGLGDGDEVAAGTDPERADSDGDGIGDRDERDNETDPTGDADGDGDGVADDRELTEGTDPAIADTDGDGLSDGNELLGFSDGGVRCSSGSNPLVPDSDGDDVDDATEARRCDGATSPTNAGVDADGDGLRSDRERVLGTLDSREDTDGDGVDDPIEVSFGSDPTSADSAPEGVETEATEPIANVGFSRELLLAPESLTDFGVIEVFPDADHDSANDDYEEAWQYDPASPADAYDDADQDFLPMWQESRLGTNPRARDSDGDGVDDGVELQDGTDPNDATSVSRAGPVTAIVAYPRRAFLRAHAFLGPAKLQLEVEGTRADQSSIDLTATGRGTAYTVEPTAAGTVDAAGGFTGAPGYTGPATITVTNLALTATVTLTIETFVPGPVAMFPLGGVPTALALGGEVVYVGGPWGLRVVDASVIEAPVARGEVALGGAPSALSAGGTWVAAANGDAVAVVDVTDGDAPRLVASIPVGGVAKGVAWAEQSVIVATPRGLVRVDPSSPGVGLVDADADEADDRIIGVEAAGSDLVAVAQDLDRVVAARADGHVLVWRIVAGGLIQELDLSAGGTARAVTLRGGVVVGAVGDNAGLLVLGSGATWRQSAPLGGLVHVGGVPDFVLATTFGTVAFLDARGAAPLTNLGNMDVTAFNQTCFAADRRYVYIGDGNNQRIEIAQHSAMQDTLGIPPVVVPVTPLTGGTIEEGTRVDVVVQAKDDVAIKELTLTRDGDDVVTAVEPPWALSLKTGNVATTTTMEIGAYATDYGDNVGTMAPLVFEVTPIADTTPPTITLLEPSPTEWVAADTPVLVAVRAEDEHAIWKVEVRLERELVATLEDAPYRTEITMPSSAPGDGLLELEVRAYDYGDGVASESATLVFAGIDLVARGITAIAADDAAYDGEDVLIRNGTVSIDGAHAFGKVRVGREGTLTHGEVSGSDDAFGLDLDVERLEVAATGSVDVSGRGYLGDCSPGDPSCGGGPNGPGNAQMGRADFGGGSHGGVGGAGPHATYGDWQAPTTHGMGGDYGSGNGEPGGDGGGRIRIVADAIVLDGVMRANGANAPETTQRNGGGGAGGSIWISAGELTGIGRIEAHGGAPASAGRSAGGGGRIALELDDAGDFDLDLVRALPGPVSRPDGKAGAGTVLLDVAGKRTLVIDDARRSAGVDNFPLGFTASATPLVVGDLVVRGASRVVLVSPLEGDLVRLEQEARLSHRETDGGTEHGLSIDVERLEIGADAAIDVVGRGYLGDCRPGDPSCGGGGHTEGLAGNGARQWSGGSHGGIGGGPQPNASYGDPLRPVTPGAGGGFGAGSGEPGGDGGGKVRIVVGALVHHGLITADGQDGIDLTQRNGSGGAGGSIWVSAGSLEGAGAIRAHGGANAPAGGGNGGGGRISIEHASGALDWGAVTAFPGAGAGVRGTAGTVHHKRGTETGVLTIDDGGLGAGDGRALAFAAGADALVLDVDLVIGGATQLVLTRPLEVATLRLEGTAVLTHLQTDASYEGGLTVVAELVHVAAGAAIDVTGRGYLGDCSAGDPSCGGGAHALNQDQGIGAHQRGGGAHGGYGGGWSGIVFGDPSAPTTLGGGGGFGVGSGEPGGDGGGRIRIVTDRLELDGDIRARGAPGQDSVQRNGSGGAGGSIWIDATTLSGGGAIDAGGGDDGPAGGSGGGGGRVALRYTTLSGFDVARATAHGGAADDAASHGGPGTVWLDGPAEDRLIVDNGGRVNVNEAAPWVAVGALSVAAKTADGIQVEGTPWYRDLLVGSEVLVGGGRFTVIGNSANALELDGGSLAAIDVGDVVAGVRALAGHLEIRGGARVAMADAIEADDLTVSGAAVLTHPPAGSGGVEPGLTLVIADTLTVAASAAIDVGERGYLGDCVPGDPSCGGGAHTLGFSQAGARQNAGGSHGGYGGGAAPGFVYGDPLAPVTLGAGGGYGAGSGEPGGRGGGRARVEADTLVLDGVLSADGQAGLALTQQNGSGGAGGSVLIAVGAIRGAGVVTAIGGSQAPNGGAGGGGGRIALAWDDAASTFDLNAINARGGASGSAPGGAGTIWLEPPTGASRLIVDNGGTVHVNEASPWPEIGVRSVQSASSDRVNVGAGLIVDAYVGAEVVIGASATRHTVVSNTTDTLVFQASDGSVAGTTGSEVRAFFVLPGRLEIVGAARVALVDRLLAEALEIGGGGVLTHPSTVAGPEHGLWVELSGALTIAADGRIDVTARGYRGDCQPGMNACGSGGMWLGNVWGGARSRSGGSYGGLGGGPQPNPIYGDPIATWLLGAGGGYGNGGGEAGGAGGGRIRLVVQALTLGGIISADGGAGNGANAGGGAGGGVLIDAGAMTGAGTISARGGDGHTSGGGGGGGRVYIDAPGAAGAPDVRGGASGDPANEGADGTSLRD